MATETSNKPAATARAAKPSNGSQGKPPEPRDHKFKRLANARMPVAIKRIRHVANLSNKLQYDYTPEQAATIVKMLRDEVDSLERRFSATATANVIPNIF